MLPNYHLNTSVDLSFENLQKPYKHLFGFCHFLFPQYIKFSYRLSNLHQISQLRQESKLLPKISSQDNHDHINRSSFSLPLSPSIISNFRTRKDNKTSLRKPQHSTTTPMSGLGILHTKNNFNTIPGSGEPHQIRLVQRGIFDTTTGWRVDGWKCCICCEDRKADSGRVMLEQKGPWDTLLR